LCESAVTDSWTPKVDLQTLIRTQSPLEVPSVRLGRDEPGQHHDPLDDRLDRRSSFGQSPSLPCHAGILAAGDRPRCEVPELPVDLGSLALK
jgi:hypothetical protein